MPGLQKKLITAENTLSTSEASAHPLPEQQEFHQHLRALAQSAVRTVLELVMLEELDAFICRRSTCTLCPKLIICAAWYTFRPT
jgi:hypothetical protein